MYPAVNANPDYTSVINQRNYQRLQDWLLDAGQKGAHIEKVSEEIIDDGTYRMVPHLVTEVTDAMKIMQEELFGPILPVLPYDSIEEALILSPAAHGLWRYTFSPMTKPCRNG